MPLKTIQDEMPTLNLTSMIDVLLLLIIFFMVGAKFTAMERKIGLKVPAVSNVSALSPAPSKRVVNVYRDGSIALDQDLVTLNELTSRLSQIRQEYADIGVIVRGDADGAFQNVADALAACHQAGISEMGISVRLAHAGTEQTPK